jgi:hypothetical protein
MKIFCWTDIWGPLLQHAGGTVIVLDENVDSAIDLAVETYTQENKDSICYNSGSDEIELRTELMKKPPKVYAGPVAVLVDGSC